MSKELTFRQVAPEILDGLCSDDPRAMASRRDLKRVNALMFHATIMAGLLRRQVAFSISGQATGRSCWLLRGVWRETGRMSS